ncbi:Adipocyte plasma membrane-associated protein [Orchesella cincta]|uniref:Adipocyte plasma membrane-associated protein n=1 Tax=Orchesella cincta TaxID=48709 RepID=A0A1D2N896_ORCCI|nr:Adipocyte plasma membrane-associated protein [Orchesella cincta]
MGVIKTLTCIIAVLALSATVLIVIPGIPPDIEPESFHIEPPIKLEGWFATNTILDEAELYFENGIAGIESVAVLADDAVFGGDHNGNVFKITGKQSAKNITQLKFPCSVDSDDRNRKCGWPLGMRLLDANNLLVMDYFGGMVQIDVKTGAYENLIPKRRPINNKIGYVPEDVDKAKDGSLYWTDGSTTGDFFTEMLGQPSGRLIKYDPKKRTNEVLLENLHFSNGICLSDDEEYILIVECGTSSIRRYYLRGEKKGKSDVFVSALPGYPDNIRPNGRGGYYVGLTAPWNDQFSMRIDLLAPRPMLRKLILRSRYLLLSIIKYLKTLVDDNIYLNLVEEYILTNGPVMNFSKLPKTATIVELSNNGDLIGVMHAKSGNIHSISQLTVGKEYAYLNSPFDSKIWRIKLETLRRMQ